MTTAMTTSPLYIGIIGAVILAMVLALLVVGLCRAAAKTPPPMPWDIYFSGSDLPTLADQMQAARGPVGGVVAEAEAVTREAVR